MDNAKILAYALKLDKELKEKGIPGDKRIKVIKEYIRILEQELKSA
jgi:hypothetical protein